MSVSTRYALVSLVAFSWLAAGCSSPKKTDLGGGCTLNSDCNSPLVCTFGKCHTACVQTLDCPLGQSCVVAAGGSVCQLPAEADCRAATCEIGTVCAVDYRCRTVCQSPIDCTPLQACVSNVCADTTDLDPSGQLPQTTPPKVDSGVDAVVCPTGAETCACYGNDTCNVGLTCASHLCVRLPGGSGGADGAVSASDSGTGGSSRLGGDTGGVKDSGGAGGSGGGADVGAGADGASGSIDGGVRVGTWVKINSASPQQSGSAAAYNPSLQRAVLFGGSTVCTNQASSNRVIDRTWEWDGDTWTLQTPTGEIPSPRCSVGMAIDRAHGEAIVHGGWAPPDNPQAGTYTYDLSTHAWKYRGANLFNLGAFPIAYDTDAGLVRIFGGNVYSTFYRDVRSWNSSTETWSSVAPAGPSARCCTGWVYDQARHRFVMFGGLSNFSAPGLADTWEYDPATTTWLQTAATTAHPGGAGPMVYDPKRKTVVMYVSANGGETWEYDAGTHLWASVPGANQLGEIGAPAIFYDERLEAVLVVGGCNGSTLQNGTWQYVRPE